MLRPKQSVAESPVPVMPLSACLAKTHWTSEGNIAGRSVEEHCADKTQRHPQRIVFFAKWRSLMRRSGDSYCKHPDEKRGYASKGDKTVILHQS